MNMKKLITTAFLMTLVSASYGQDVETIPASTFFADEDVSDIKISPDGKHLGILIPEEGGSNLTIINTDYQ